MRGRIWKAYELFSVHFILYFHSTYVLVSNLAQQHFSLIMSYCPYLLSLFLSISVRVSDGIKQQKPMLGPLHGGFLRA